MVNRSLIWKYFHHDSIYSLPWTIMSLNDQNLLATSTFYNMIPAFAQGLRSCWIHLKNNEHTTIADVFPRSPLLLWLRLVYVVSHANEHMVLDEHSKNSLVFTILYQIVAVAVPLGQRGARNNFFATTVCFSNCSPLKALCARFEIGCSFCMPFKTKLSPINLLSLFWKEISYAIVFQETCVGWHRPPIPPWKASILFSSPFRKRSPPHSVSQLPRIS